LVEAGVISREDLENAARIIEAADAERPEPRRLECRSRAETAKVLGISTRSLDRLAASGELKPRRVGKRRKVYRESDIVDYLSGSKGEVA
jgi:excisionase family DNA binding protein